MNGNGVGCSILGVLEDPAKADEAVIGSVGNKFEALPDFPHQNTPRIKNTRIRISPRTLIINYSTTTYPNKIILNHMVESIEILSLCNSIFLSKAL